MIAALALVAASALPAQSSAGGVPGAPQLVADLGNTVPWPWEQMAPSNWIRLGDELVFFHDDGIHGWELWATDGTAPGTRMVADLCPGRCGTEAAWTAARTLIGSGTQVMFIGNDGVTGHEPWVWDGTNPPIPLGDLRPGPDGSMPQVLAGGPLGFAFTVDDGVHGREPWVSDGTAAGTRLLADLTPGAAQSSIQTLLWFGQRLLLDVGWPAESTLLLALDGSQQTLPFRIGFASSIFGWRPPRLPDGDILVVDNAAETGLWRLDLDTGASTLVGGGGLPGPRPAGTAGIAFASGAVMPVRDSQGDRRLGFSDGSSLSPLPGSPHVGGGSLLPTLMGTTPQSVVFPGSADGVSVLQPWSWSAGNGFMQLATLGEPDRGPYAADFFCALSNPCQYPSAVSLPDRVLLLVDDLTEGRSMWATDGTPAGTSFLSDLGAPGPIDAIREGYLGAGTRDLLPDGSLLFTTWRSEAIELWRSDGSGSGTGVLQELNLRTDAFTPPTSPLGTAHFGTPSIPTLVRSDPRVLIQSQERPFPSVGAAWWLWDGATTLPLLAAGPGAGNAVALGDRVLLLQPTSDRETALWRLDPGSTTPQALVGLPAPSHPTAPLIAGHGSFWYAAEVGVVRTDFVTTTVFPSYAYILVAGSSGVLAIGNELSILPAGSGEVRVVMDGDDMLSTTTIPLAAGLGTGWVFNAERPDSGWELWFSDGTPENTRLIRDIQPGPGDGIPPPLFTSRTYPSTARLAESLVFLADDGTCGAEPWVTDGTTAQLVADLNPGAAGSWPQDFHQVAGSVLFVADDGTHGRELRVLSEAADGVGLVDLLPGPASSRPEVLATRGPFAYVAAHEPQFGRELWRLDLRDRSLVRLTDLMPGPLPSSPTHLVVIGTTLLFTAHDPEHGFELFQLTDPALSIFADGFESGDTTAWVD